MNPSDQNFSSRSRVMIVAFLVASLAIGGMVFVVEAHSVPSLRREYDRRVSTMPGYFAAANQKALASGDIAAMRSTLDQIMAGSQGNGLKYIIIQDADGKIMADVYSADMARTEKDMVIRDIQKSVLKQDDAAAAGSAEKDQSMMQKLEQDATKENQAAGAAAAPAPLSDILPAIEKSGSWRLMSFDPPIVDFTVPITTGTISFGGVRVGVADEVTPGISDLRTYSYSGAVAILIFSQVLAIFIAAGLDAGVMDFASSGADGVRKELEQRIKQLELEQTRKEEENPISPAEFLSLLDFARKVSGSLDYNEVLSISIHSCLQVMNIRDVSIFVLDPVANELVGRIGHDENGFMDETEMAKIRVPIGKGDIGTAAEFGTTTTIDSPRPGAAVVSALVAHGRTIGVVLVRNKLNGRPFVKKDQTMLRIFSGLLANAMENTAIFHHMNAARQ